MKATLNEGGRRWTVDFAAPLDISIELNPHSDDQPRAFSLPPARALAVEVGPFVGDTRRGGSCNCEMVTLYPHGNGTHTECVGHVTRERIGVQSLLRDVFLPATLLTVHPQSFAESGETYPAPHAACELAVTRASIERAVEALGGVEAGFLQALVLRTVPNSAIKCHRSYSGAGTAYLTWEAMAWIFPRSTARTTAAVCRSTAPSGTCCPTALSARRRRAGDRSRRWCTSRTGSPTASTWSTSRSRRSP